MNGRKMTDEQFAEARRLYETGEVSGVKELGARFNVNFSTMAYHLRRRGTKMRRGRPKGSRHEYAAKRTEALRRVRDGEKLQAIERSLGLGSGTVSRWCKQDGVRRVVRPLPRSLRVVDEAVTLLNRTQDAAHSPRDLVLELRAKGISPKGIAADLGFHVGTVRRWLNEARRQRDERIVAMLADGVPVVAIAEAFGVSRAYVSMLGADRKERAA